MDSERKKRCVVYISTIEIEWHYLQPACALCNSRSFILTKFFKHISQQNSICCFFCFPSSINNEKFVHRPCVTLYTTSQSYFWVESLFCLFMVTLSCSIGISNGVMRLLAYDSVPYWKGMTVGLYKLINSIIHK